jgi:mRNA deadenylase 3'-5' endonuclease subunit Ccr4
MHRDYQMPQAASSEVSVATYNTLADCYSGSHTSTHYRYLDFEYRGPLIAEKIAGFNTDFICLQEVDHYQDFFHSVLKSLDYQSAYVMRTGSKTDGSVLAWKKEYWESILLKEIKFNDHPLAEMKPVFKQDNVAMLGVFRHRHAPIDVIVVSAHLFWNPRLERVKLAQAHMLLQEVDACKERWPSARVIIAGDFNSLPKSKVVALMQGDRERFKDIAKLLAAGLPSLKSAYACYCSEGHPPFTNFTRDFVGTLDYIFYSHDFTLVSLVDVLSEEEAARETCIPNSFEPSDHLPLVAVLI